MLPRTHPIGHRIEVSCSDITHEPAICIDLPPNRDRSIEFLRTAGVDPRIHWTTSNLATVTPLVAKRIDCSLRYPLPGEASSYHSDVIEVPLADPIPKNDVSAVLPTGVLAPRMIDRAIHYLCQYFDR